MLEHWSRQVITRRGRNDARTYCGYRRRMTLGQTMTLRADGIRAAQRCTVSAHEATQADARDGGQKSAELMPSRARADVAGLKAASSAITIDYAAMRARDGRR